MIKVLVVDDSALVRKLFVGVLGDEPDLEVQVARNGLEALERLEDFHPDVITLDIHMPQMGGLECLDRIMVESPRPVVMVSSLTAEGAHETLEALRLGAVDFVTKPAGAVSLRIAELAPTLIAKVRAAAGAKIKKSARLRERVRHKTSRRRSHAAGDAHRRPRRARPTGAGLVLVGTSTGGPPALEALLTRLPAAFPWPILVAQHMPAAFTGPLAKRLDKLCALNVVEVLGPTALEPGTVYVGRGDADLVVSTRGAGLVALSSPARVAYPWHPSTDRLVRSALEHVEPQQLVGILMTGMGDDGAAAMTELRARGGTTIAEAEDTAVVWGMPRELVEAGGADFVEPVHEIASRLSQIVPSHAANP